MFSWKITVIALLLSTCLPCYAVGEGGTMVNFKGLVVEKNPCSINNDSQITVPFNKVNVNDADGKKIQKKLDIKVQCTGSTSKDRLKMQIIGETSNDNYILDTDRIDDVGIKFYQNGNPIQLRTWFNLPNPVESLSLTASPMILHGNDQTGGDFKATATLLLNVQ